MHGMQPAAATAVDLPQVTAEPAVRLSARWIAACLLAVGLAALACHFVPPDSAVVAALKVCSATLALAVVPGALVTLAWRPRPQLTLLEVIGYGLAVSYGLAQTLVIAAVLLHTSPVVMLLCVGGLSAALAVRILKVPSATVLLTADELIVAGLLVLLAVPLYLQGSPVQMYEDQVLVAIVRRLSALNTPDIENLYVAPGIVYAYPFPGGLYLMALIARLGDIDSLFLYHKLRFLWGPAALVMLYLGARSVFGRPAVAAASTITATVLVCAGTFAHVSGFPAWWGQLVPYSYGPDVAMTVLLPALLAVTFEYVQSAGGRERSFFLTAAVMLVLVLTMIHIREIVQFAAYLGCFVVLAAASRHLRPYLRRSAALLGITVLIVVTYTRWQSTVVSTVTTIVAGHRAELLSLATSVPPAALVLQPSWEVLGTFVQDFDEIFAGLVPFFLCAGPAVIVFFRERPFVWLISLSTMAYLAVLTFPVLAVPYIYATYFEILHVPVRNVIFFLYLVAGAWIYVTVVAVARMDRTRLLVLLAGAVSGALALLVTLCVNRTQRGLFLPLIAAYGLTFVFAFGGTAGRSAASRRIVAAVVGLIALLALWPDHSPAVRTAAVNVRWTTGLPDARRTALEREFGLVSGERSGNSSDVANVWGYRLTDLSRENVRSLVTHPEVVDTNDIDRTAFTVPTQPPRRDDQFLGVEHVAWLQYPGMWLLAITALFVWTTALLLPAALASARGRNAAAVIERDLREPFYRRALPYAAFIIPFALWSARPTLSPLAMAPMPPAGRVDTPAAMLAEIRCVELPPMPARFAEEEVVLPARTVCPPSPAVVEWIRANVPVDAVLAIDRWTPFPPQVFVPQQAIVFPTLDASFIREDALFADYYRLFEERMRRYRVQPFFNTVETAEERAAFVQTLGVTHVLIGPAHYGDLRPVLDALPAQFARRYDDAQWAVYEAGAHRVAN